MRSVVKKALVDKVLRSRAIRVDSTVTDADIRYPTDTGLARDAVRLPARAGRQLARLRALTRTLRRRSAEAKGAVQRLTEEAAAQVRASVREVERLLVAAGVRALWVPASPGVSEPRPSPGWRR